MQVITQFLKMETLIDDSVNQTIDIQVERGGTSFTVHLVVRCFHFTTLNSSLSNLIAIICKNIFVYVAHNLWNKNKFQSLGQMQIVETTANQSGSVKEFSGWILCVFEIDFQDVKSAFTN